MKELAPARAETLIKMRTLEKGMTRSREMEAGRAEYKAREGRNPTVTWTHPKDGMITTELDAKLIHAMEGGSAGAFRGLIADGYADIAKTIFNKNR